MNLSWNTAGFRNHHVQFAAAAAPGQFENNDYLVLEADTDGDGAFETTIASFSANEGTAPGSHKDLALNRTGTRLTRTFQDFRFPLALTVHHPVRFRLRVFNTSGNEELAFDSLRLLGEPIPPGIDSDGDGSSDLDESIAGTDPTNPASRVIPILSRDNDGRLRTTIPGIARRHYVLQRSTSLTQPDWTTVVSSGVLAHDQSVILADADTFPSPVFYRIVVTVP
jgi:hypothetical protein